jgi:hypothetical protein
VRECVSFERERERERERGWCEMMGIVYVHARERERENCLKSFRTFESAL